MIYFRDELPHKTIVLVAANGQLDTYKFETEGAQEIAALFLRGDTEEENLVQVPVRVEEPEKVTAAQLFEALNQLRKEFEKQKRAELRVELYVAGPWFVVEPAPETP